ncbi:hypothetical protein [Pseudarthrobacter sp. fls2-241-R2A-168]|uniref:hypothetical protein n=1 Tax=Pseudarthrobacter sp. fls2-241-R2A-168 TaxID=3040304 RepID=UPI00255239A2|nr:hypothetical protein [Pseudarthrobacter sp. fls2-241-R2A-168]
MITAVARRIQTTWAAELSLFHQQMHSLAWQDIGEGGVEGAATAMARKASCINHGVSVDVVCFAQRAAPGHAPFMLSVAMHVHPQRRSLDVYWEEADAWAQAATNHEWFTMEPRGGLETVDGRIYHYALVQKPQVTQEAQEGADAF